MAQKPKRINYPDNANFLNAGGTPLIHRNIIPVQLLKSHRDLCAYLNITARFVAQQTENSVTPVSDLYTKTLLKRDELLRAVKQMHQALNCIRLSSLQFPGQAGLYLIPSNITNQRMLKAGLQSYARSGFLQLADSYWNGVYQVFAKQAKIQKSHYS